MKTDNTMMGFGFENIWVNEFCLLANGPILYSTGDGSREIKKEE